MNRKKKSSVKMSPAIFAHLDCTMINQLGFISLLTAPQRNFSVASKFNRSFYYYFSLSLSTSCVSNVVCSKVFIMPPGVVLPWQHRVLWEIKRVEKHTSSAVALPTFV
ncbi:hypothetical protein CDAR_429271 [Caerostris darwini]|uniref:Uncharacterized protein n=1 Tax=Caerostris darwini TaxID=1538125 RepID=A0AAV4RSQ3_9ARAC|nr:hypothetical protein CDAR_429271 [Caerostris darwini]